MDEQGLDARSPGARDGRPGSGGRAERSSPHVDPLRRARAVPPLLRPLRVSEIRAAEAAVIEPDVAQEDPESTDLFRQAVEVLRADLQRNDPELAAGLKVRWDSLAEFIVKVHSTLTLGVGVASGDVYDCAVRAKVDAAHATVFVRERAELPLVDGGGRALAALFEADARRVAQAWRAACDGAEAGLEARRFELARERAEREEAELDTDRRLAEFQGRIASKHRSSRGAKGRGAGGPQRASAAARARARGESAARLGEPRALVDPHSLGLVDPEGRVTKGAPPDTSAAGRRAGRAGGLNEPRRGSGGPRNRTPLRDTRPWTGKMWGSRSCKCCSAATRATSSTYERNAESAPTPSTG